MRNILLLIALIVGTCVVFLLAVVPDCVDRCIYTHQSLIDGTAGSPYRYRILFPYTLHFFVPEAYSDELTYIVSSTLANFLLIAAYLSLFFAILKQIVGKHAAMISSILMSVLLMAMFHAIFPLWRAWVFIEGIAMLLGLWLLYNQPKYWRWLFTVVLIIACFNRATGGLVALLYIFIRLGEDKTWRQYMLWSGLYIGITLGIAAGLRLWLGNAEALTPFLTATIYLLTRNQGEAGLWASMMIPLIILIIMNRNNVPKIIQRALWILPLYFAAIIARAGFNELALYLSISPIFVPVIVAHIQQNEAA